MSLHTNFYKLPMAKLEKRVNDLRLIWWRFKDNDPKQKQIDNALSLAYTAMIDRKNTNDIPKKWKNIPEKYEDNSNEEDSASGMA